jgi:two-component system response regulator
MTNEQVILLVEDNDDDAELTTMAFKAARLFNRLVRVRDGVEALDYLNARGSYAGRDIDDVPALVLLDINLPRLNGLEVLAAIRATPPIQHVPVVMLTSSDEEKDRLAAYSHCANSYVRKPVDYDAFVTAAKDLGLYWLVLNRPLPRRMG